MPKNRGKIITLLFLKEEILERVEAPFSQMGAVGQISPNSGREERHDGRFYRA